MNDTFEVPIESRANYIRRRQSDILRMKSDLNGSDFQFIKQIGHQMKGNAVTFQFPELADIGRRLEASAQDGDKTQIHKILNEFEAIIQNSLSLLRLNASV